MTKPKKRGTDAPQPPAQRSAPEGVAPSTLDAAAPKGQPDQRATLSSSLSAGLPAYDSVAQPGALAPLASPPEIPADIDAELNPRERRIVWLMINGASFNAALQQTLRADGRERSLTRSDVIPPAIVAAVAAVYRQIAASCGLNRGWIIAQTVALFERACAAVPVLDRKGRPTGDFRFDGPTAAKCLDMLAQWNGDLYPRKGAGIPAGDVAELLRAVTARGRPGLEERRPERLVGESSAANAPER